MDDASLILLHRLIAVGGRSLLQYVSESCPWTTDQTQIEFTQILALAQEERDAVGKLTRYLQKHHKRRIVTGSYPSYYTLMNYITIDHLLPKLIADSKNQIAEIDKTTLVEKNAEVRALIHGYLEMKRRHLATLNSMWAPLEKPVVSST